MLSVVFNFFQATECDRRSRALARLPVFINEQNLSTNFNNKAEAILPLHGITHLPAGAGRAACQLNLLIGCRVSHPWEVNFFTESECIRLTFISAATTASDGPSFMTPVLKSRFSTSASPEKECNICL